MASPLDYKIIGERLQKARKSKKITQAQLAESLDISNTSISRIERGDLKVGLPRLYAICEKLNISASSILTGLPSLPSSMPLNSEFQQLLSNSSFSEQKMIYEIAKTVIKVNKELNS